MMNEQKRGGGTKEEESKMVSSMTMPRDHWGQLLPSSPIAPIVQYSCSPCSHSEGGTDGGHLGSGLPSWGCPLQAAAWKQLSPRCMTPCRFGESGEWLKGPRDDALACRRQRGKIHVLCRMRVGHDSALDCRQMALHVLPFTIHYTT